jgi:hypothetical protein
VTSISYSVVESPHVTRDKKKSVSHGKIEGALLLTLMCQIVEQALINVQVGEMI